MVHLLLLCAVLLGFGAGVCCFSFLNVVVWRLPRREPFFVGRSRCPACGRTLMPWELVPCVSFLALGGRCHGCGAPIPRRDFWVEALGGALFLACAVRFGPGMARPALSFAVLFLLTAVALLDWDTMEIDDRFHAAIFLCALLAVKLFPEISIPSRLIGAFCVSVPMLLLALVIPGGFGGGDIKLMFALGLYLGWKQTLLTAFFAVLGGGGYAMHLLKTGKAGRRDQFAFGPFLCAGAALALLCGEAILGWYTLLW